MKSGNPVLKAERFQEQPYDGTFMTVSGTVNKTAILLALMLITAGWSWSYYFSGGTQMGLVMIGGIIGGLVMALITTFRPQTARYTAPLYALAEGLAIGGLSAYYDSRFYGIVIPAAGLTFGTLAVMLVVYKAGIIRATEKFKMGLIAATGAIGLLYLVDIILRLFGMPIGFIHEGGIIGIGFSLIVVGVASLNLIMDFDFVERATEAGMPKYMEWYGAFGLITTLVWLYIEMLRLLSKLQKR